MDGWDLMNGNGALHGDTGAGGGDRQQQRDGGGRWPLILLAAGRNMAAVAPNVDFDTLTVRKMSSSSRHLGAAAWEQLDDKSSLNIKL